MGIGQDVFGEAAVHRIAGVLLPVHRVSQPPMQCLQ